MKSHQAYLPIVILLIAALACSLGGSDIEADVEFSNCSTVCGNATECTTARADVPENAGKTTRFALATKDDTGEERYPEGLNKANVTIRVTVAGTGTVKVTYKTADGKEAELTATNTQPAELTTEIQVKLVSYTPSENNPTTETAFLYMTFDGIGGTAEGVQAFVTMNDCYPPFCVPTNAVCQ